MPEYFTLAELRALPDMSNTGRYSDPLAEDAAAYIVGVIERVVGTSFVARTVADEVHDGGGDAVLLRSPFVLSVTSATENGVPVSHQLRAVGGVLRRFAAGSYVPSSWAAGVGNVAVTYQTGYSSTPPDDVKAAALQGTRARLLSTASNSVMADRTSSISNDAGGTTSFVLAGEGRPTGYPDVDAVILGWRDRLDVFGFC